MYLAPLRGGPVLAGKRVLLIDGNSRTRNVRLRVFHTHEVEVDAVESLEVARVFWRPKAYSVILLDIRTQSPVDALQFYQQIKDASPRQRFAFLVGPPVYLSLTWPDEVMAAEKRPQQWAETVKRFVAAA